MTTADESRHTLPEVSEERSVDEQRDRIVAALNAITNLAEVLADMSGTEEVVRTGTVIERTYAGFQDAGSWGADIVLPTLSFALAAQFATAQTNVICDAPPLSPDICDKILNQKGAPHYRCHHGPPAHCYDLDGYPITCP